MTRFYITISNFDKWAHQNKISYTGFYEEGVLCDNFIVETKRGVAAVYEHYRNEWASDYYVEFVDYKNGFKNGEVDALWAKWYDFEMQTRDQGGWLR